MDLNIWSNSLMLMYQNWLSKNDFICMGISVILKSLKKNCKVRKNFIVSEKVKN